MPTYKYIAKDENAVTITGKISAEKEDLVMQELRKRNLVVVSLSEIKKGSFKNISLGTSSVRGDDLVIFARQLATMIEAGIPILQSLEALEEQMAHPYFKSVIAAVREDVAAGNSLSAAFAKYPNVFDTLFVSMVKAGETGGALHALLDRIAGYMEKTLKLKRKVKSAMVYPAVVISMAIIITLVLLMKVVPTFKEIYDSLGQELPALTQILLAISEHLQAGFFWFLGLSVIAFIGFINYRKTERGSLQVDRVFLRMPIFGPLIQKVAISRFSRTLATLIQSGVPILTSLDIVGKSSGNRVIEVVSQDVCDHIRQGESIAEPLSKNKIFPSMVVRMISVGEKTGKLEAMLIKIAEFYEDQVDAAVAGLTSMIEPLIIGFLGIVVGFIIIALFLPIIGMTSMIR